MKHKPRGHGAGPYLKLNADRKPPADDVRIRCEERDQRAAADTRTEAQRWLNDPPPGRSALATKR